jgi:hypothetical protein
MNRSTPGKLAMIITNAREMIFCGDIIESPGFAQTQGFILWK